MNHDHHHTYILTYIHTYIHTYIYTYIQVDTAIYDNETNLIKVCTSLPTYLHTYIHIYIHTYIHGAYKLHPKLVGKEAEGFTYGYNLKKFPDEPIKVGR